MENKRNIFPNQLAKDLENASYEVRYDMFVKQILANKDILARILSATIAEYKGYSLEEIKLLIEDDIAIDCQPLEPHTSDVNSYSPKIIGMNTESNIPGEGRIVYDIKFSAFIPNKDEKIKLIVNLEAQQKFSTPYDLVTRGILYTCRMISEQLGREFEIGKNNSYDDIKKVYSIWICMDTPQDVANSITEFKMTKNSIYGTFKREARYDLQSVIFICLGKAARQTENELIGMLDTLLASDIDVRTKEITLSEKYKLNLRETYEGTVDFMCNLSQGILERGRQEGRQEGLLEGRQKGKLDILFTLYNEKIINLTQAYEKTSLSPEEFDEAYAKWCEDNNKQ
ncbi:hypothetical protein [Lachnobacterium bovis]|uniref:hypothetical protein n=1 Tax=Lachnobacterium bovis TaxID=140626 RepID=UPI000491809E|nr:hypothetical protein [Lachnobacterium bovis]